MQSIKIIWTNLTSKYSTDLQLITELWTEIESSYSESSRHYHDLSHIENMLRHAFDQKESIMDFDVLLFSIFYHDIIYKATRKDNEEQSAEIAIKRLEQLDVPKTKIERCKEQILATKSHFSINDSDTALLLDIDLSVLGGSWDDYQNYYRGVRLEYNVYPDLLYKPGRKKVLTHFLEMKEIYKTDVFRNKLESKARENMKRELEELS